MDNLNINLNGKKALVLGASRGIGLATAKALSESSAELLVVSRSEMAAESFKPEFFLKYDLESSEARAECLQEITNIGFLPDIIVHNLGGNLGLTDPLMTSTDFFRVLKFNLETAIDANNRFLPNMMEKGWGRIVHTSSISALENQGPPSYCAAKAALNAYVRSFGRYVAKYGIATSSVMPGAIWTNGGYWDTQSQDNPKHVDDYLKNRMAINRFGTVEEISNFIVFLCSDHASFVTGSNFLVDGGQGRSFQHD